MREKTASIIREEASFKILRLLHGNPRLTQRQLGVRAGVSLGAVNYCVRALVERGLVKVGNFTRCTDKRGYCYVLTPAGMAEKARLTSQFLVLKNKEFMALRDEIAELSRLPHPNEVAKAS